jgi:hypothetical protein
MSVTGAQAGCPCAAASEPTGAMPNLRNALYMFQISHCVAHNSRRTNSHVHVMMHKHSTQQPLSDLRHCW